LLQIGIVSLALGFMLTLPGVRTQTVARYVTRNLYRTFYGDTVANIARWLDGRS